MPEAASTWPRLISPHPQRPCPESIFVCGATPASIRQSPDQRCDPRGVWPVRSGQHGAPVNRFPRTHLYLDQYTGAVLATKDPKTDGTGDTILNWLVPLHDGKAFGMAGRVMVMILGLMPAVMFVTGFFRGNRSAYRVRRACRGRSGLVRRPEGGLMKYALPLIVAISLAGVTIDAHGIWFAERSGELALVYGEGAEDDAIVSRAANVTGIAAYDAKGAAVP